MLHGSVRLSAVLLCAAGVSSSGQPALDRPRGATPLDDTSSLHDMGRGSRTPHPALHPHASLGTVRDAHGRPIAGAFVSARDSARGITVTVVTDAEGHYHFATLDSTFRLIAHRVGFRASERPLTSGDAKPVDFALEPVAEIFDQLPSSSLLSLLPDGDTKRRFILDCTGCHQFDQRIVRPGGKARSRKDWIARIQQMLSFAGPESPFPIIAPGRDPDTTAAWLMRYLGGAASAPPRITQPPPLTAEGAKVVITEYDLPTPQDLPHDLMLDSAGRVIITGMFTDRMYVLDPTTGRFTHEPIPLKQADPRALHVDADGTWWVLLGVPHKIARRDRATGKWAFHDIGMYGHSIARDSAGGVWFNGHFTKDPALIGRLDARTGRVRTYTIPRAERFPTGGSPIPYELRIADDGTVWGSELHGNRVFRFTPSTGAFRTYTMPTPHSGPRRLDVGPDGTVWIPAYAASTLARLDPATGTIAEFRLPTRDALPYVARVDRRTGAVWVATGAGDLIARFDPMGERWTEYRLPSRGALVRHIDIDGRTGAVWAAYSPAPGAPPKIARLEVASRATPGT